MGFLIGLLPYLTSFLLAAPLLTWLITWNRFRNANARDPSQDNFKKQQDNPPPSIPYSTPWLGDAVVALLDLQRYVSSVL